LSSQRIWKSALFIITKQCTCAPPEIKICQKGKLVGAVTHVLVNDPTTGYGIFIENMLDAAA
jgi:hypothetical protein